MMRRGHVPGLSIAVVDRDRLLFACSYGLAGRAANQAAGTGTAYLWFSLTKVVTATASLRLAHEGRLDLDAPVGEYLDYLWAPGPAQPSVRQLLNHTAGLGNPLPVRWVHPADVDPPDPEAMVQHLLGRRRAYRYPVGAVARYSNLGYLAVGEIIAAAAGMSFQDYLRQAVLDPLGMSETGFGYSIGHDVATGYLRAPRVVDPLLRRMLPAGVVGQRQGPSLALNRFLVDGSGYGGLVGHVLDASRFLRMHCATASSTDSACSAPAPARSCASSINGGKPFDHGLGWFRRPTQQPGHWVERFGAGAGFWNMMRLYPDQGLGVVIMSNSTAGYDFEPLCARLAGASWP